MEKKQNWKWLYVAALLILTVWLVILTVNKPEIPKIKQEGEWKCSQMLCEESTTAEQWINDNCFVQEDKSMVCGVIIDGTKQLVPLENIDTSTLNQCLKARCVQEAYTRATNYSIDLRQQANQTQ